MSGLNGVLNNALTGLQAYRAALNTVSENVSNATTPGYARRAPELAALFQGPQQLSGTGVSITDITRISSSFANTRLRAAMSGKGMADAVVSALTTLQGNFPSSGGISQALNQFFSDAKTLSTKPADPPTRQTLIADGQQLAGAFQDVAGNIRDSLNGLSQSALQLTDQVNQVLGQLAELNQQLRNSGGKNINTLLDNQQQALQGLAKLINARVIRHANGTVRLSVRGQVLIDSSGATTLKLAQAADGSLELQMPNGHVLDPSSTSGQLGGTMLAWTQSNTQLQALNRMATVTSWLVNAQQAQGLNATGTQGAALFSLPTPSVVAQPTNAGTETLSASLTDATQLPPDGGPFTVSYNGTQWQASDQVSGKVTSLGAGPTLAFSGIQVTVSGGAPVVGDSFTVNPVYDAAAGMQMTTSDPNAIAAAAPYVSTAGVVSASGAVTDSNAGTGAVSSGTLSSAPSAGALTVPASYFGQSLQVTFTSPTTYQVQTTAGTVIATGTYSGTSGGAVDFAYPVGAAGGKYWQMNISGQPATGDTFTFSPGGVLSGANADALGQLASASSLVDGSLNDAWSYVTDSVGMATQSAQTSQSNAQATLQSAQSAQQAISGVSLDQQAGEMQLYTQAYQASAKAIATVNTLFQSLLNVA